MEFYCYPHRGDKDNTIVSSSFIVHAGANPENLSNIVSYTSTSGTGAHCAACVGKEIVVPQIKNLLGTVCCAIHVHSTCPSETNDESETILRRAKQMARVK